MKKGYIFGLLVILALVSSLGMAATEHNVTVTIPEYVMISVGNDVDLGEAQFNDDGIATPSGTGNVLVKTNAATAYDITATAAPNGAAVLPASKLMVNGTAFNGTVTAFKHTSGKTDGWKSYDVTYQANLDGSEDPGNYAWTVIYTAVAQ